MRDARDVMHAGITNWHFPLKPVAGKTSPAFPADVQPIILLIWEETHELAKSTRRVDIYIQINIRGFMISTMLAYIKYLAKRLYAGMCRTCFKTHYKLLFLLFETNVYRINSTRELYL